MAETTDIERPKDDVLTRALKRFDSSVVAVQEERALALQDRRFVTIAGAQWEGNWAEQWANSPMVEVNKTAAGLEKIIGHYRKNRIIVNFRGVDKGADEDTADTLDGMFRADVYWSKGQQAFDNAFEEGAQGGIGAWRLCNEREDRYDPENKKQRIAFKLIADADQSVFWDPNAKLYDKSDAMWCVVITAMARDAFNEEYAGEFDGSGPWPDGLWKTNYDFYTPDVVKIAEYYEVEEKERNLRIFKHRATDEERREWAADLNAEALADMTAEGWREVRVIKGLRRRVKKWTLSGSAVLKGPNTIAGTEIPVVPYYGKRWFVDNMERSCGHVRRAKDPQRIYNAQISKLVETSAYAPIERPIFDPEQVEGFQDQWAEANINRAPYALARALRNEDGSIAVPGPLGKVEPPQVQPAMAALIQISAADIAELTNADDGADEVKSNISAEAMDIAATRTDDKAEIYLDNFRQSMQRCGEIYQAMAAEVYVEEGREVDTLTADGKTHGKATLFEGVTDDLGRYRIRNDLSAGKYRVISDVTEKTATRRDKTVRSLVGIAQIAQQTDPTLASAALNTAVQNMDGEGIKELQEWNRKRLVAEGVIQPTEEEAEAMAQAAQEQKPDPQAEALQAVAEKERAAAGKYVADTALSEAKTEQTIALTEKARVETEGAQTERKLGVFDRIGAMFGGGQRAA